MTISITAKNFTTKLNSTVKAHTNQRDNLQELLVFGLAFYQEGGDTVYLTKVLNACIGVKSLSTIKMKDYIKSLANVKWVKTTDKSLVFKKIKGEVPTLAVEKIEDLLTIEKWYEFEDAKHQAKADVHPLAQFKAWCTRTQKAIDAGLVKDSEELEKALDIIKNSKALLA